MESVFNRLNAINVNDHTEKKETDGGRTLLTYLSWPFAWAEVKKLYPDAQYTIIKDAAGLPYFSDPRTGIMVYTTVTIEGVTHEMWLPVMDSNNKAMRFEPYEIQTKYKTITVKAATMFDINKTIMRCLVKNLAMFGLGLYIYAGEDLPEDEADQKPAQKPTEADKALERAKANPLNQPGARQLATNEQKAALRGMVNIEQMDACNRMYGDNWERMTANQCAAMLNKLNRERAAS